MRTKELTVDASETFILQDFHVPVLQGAKLAPKWPRYFRVSLEGRVPNTIRLLDECETVVGSCDGFLYRHNQELHAIYWRDNQIWLALPGMGACRLFPSESNLNVRFENRILYRRFTINCGDSIFKKMYLSPLVADFFGDAMTDQFHDFFRYVAEEVKSDFSRFRCVRSGSS
jgi:hypothetical protein